MGVVNSTGSGNVFKQAFNQILKGSECVSLFDHAWATLHGAGYHSTVYQYSVANGYVPIEFEARHLGESTLVKHICLPSTQAHPDLSSYRRISAAMEQRSSGLVVVHNAHLLNAGTTHLLARLATYIKGKKLDWKIILFADTKALDQLNLAQLGVEKSFPDSCLKPDWRPDASIQIKSKNLAEDGIGNSIRYAAGITLGLLVIAIGLKLIY